MEAQFSKDNLENNREEYDKLMKEAHDEKVLKQAMTNVIKSDYARGRGLRHYKNKLPPIPLDQTSEAIRELNRQVSILENENACLQTKFENF